MVAMSLTMETFKYSEATASECPIWELRFENFLLLSNIDIEIKA
jgi:hypothetical protein